MKTAMKLFHCATPKDVQMYHKSGYIRKPVRGFTTLAGALVWALKTGHTVILEVSGLDCHKLPDHHNRHGEAWWIDHDVEDWKCVLAPNERKAERLIDLLRNLQDSAS